jgi:hypothetical protein
MLRVLLLAESCGLSSFLQRGLLLWRDLAAACFAAFAADLSEVFLEVFFHAFERSTPVFQLATNMRSRIAIGKDAPRFSRYAMSDGTQSEGTRTTDSSTPLTEISATDSEACIVVCLLDEIVDA